MDPRIEFHFDFGSPNAYLSHLVIPQIEARLGARFEYIPILLGGVFKATGNVSPAVSLQGIKNKPEYMALETRRFLARWGVTNFARNPHFPVNTLQLMRGAFAARDLGCYEGYIENMFRCMWSEPRNMEDPDIIRAALDEARLPAAEIMDAIQQPELKARLIESTEDSVARGVFGSPSFFVGDALFFGKDTLRDVEEEIEAQRATA